MLVDGVKVDGKLLPIMAGRTVTVEITLGE